MLEEAFVNHYYSFQPVQPWLGQDLTPRRNGSPSLGPFQPSFLAFRQNERHRVGAGLSTAGAAGCPGTEETPGSCRRLWGGPGCSVLCCVQRKKGTCPVCVCLLVVLVPHALSSSFPARFRQVSLCGGPGWGRKDRAGAQAVPRVLLVSAEGRAGARKHVGLSVT